MKSIYYAETKADFNEVFAAPGVIYRDAPFWAWNCELQPEELRRQIANFRRMGMGGFFMHSRTGMATHYLGKDFMACIQACVESARSEDMYAYLYDEDRWPSGSAGGIVTKNHEYRGRHLLITQDVHPEEKLLCCFAIKLDVNDCLESARMIEPEAALLKEESRYFIYRQIKKDVDWFNGEAYLDTLNPEAVHKFIETTHEAYYRNVGDEFGKLVPMIFTDEPESGRKDFFHFAREKRDLILPWTETFNESYFNAYGTEFLPTIPELLWQLPDGKYSVARYRYHDHLTECFVSACCDQLGSWCEAHAIYLTGHMMQEVSLESQTGYIGEAMRAYRCFQLPGIDMLCDAYEFSTVKQAASISHQYGRGGVLSELDGVTDWDFNFAGHKGHGDWQAALGVTFRVPHLAYLSMGGEAKRDYPASISYQSPWNEKYHLIADHFARVNVAMTRGQARVRIGVIHPIESYWLHFGPQEQTATKRRQAEENFNNLLQWLLYGMLDFDFICESLLPQLSSVQSGDGFIVGEMTYDVVIVPPTVTLRNSTLECLEKFVSVGGKVIFSGSIASLADGIESVRPAELAAKCESIVFERTALYDALEKYREVTVICDDGSPADSLIYQMRQEGETRYLFFVNTARMGKSFHGIVKIRGSWQLFSLDTITGDITPIEGQQENRWTILDYDFHAHGHLLLKLEPAEKSAGETPRRILWRDAEVEQASVGFLRGNSGIPVTLDEPNVLLLDQAEWKLSTDNKWSSREELLRLDNAARVKLGLPPISGGGIQPWVKRASSKILDTLEMRFIVKSKIAVSGAKLALEQPENVRIFWDGVEIPVREAGFWTDRAIKCVIMPDFDAGEHELLIHRSYSAQTHVEWMYLLGNFGVQLQGRDAIIVAPVSKLAFGDVTVQGLPFYGGNITYHFEYELPETKQLALHLSTRATNVPPGLENGCAAREVPYSAYYGTLLTVKLDGHEVGHLAFSPFECYLGNVSSGKHVFDLTLYGSRVNCFGAVHLSFRHAWMGPGAWRTQGDMFSYEYRIQPFGICIAPRLLEY